MISSKEASIKAKEAARDAFESIDFLTHDDVVDLMIQNNLGWNSEKLEFWALDEHFWDDLEGKANESNLQHLPIGAFDEGPSKQA